MGKGNVAESLKHVLADSYVLYVKTQNYHWNVKCGNFKSLHEMFGAFYEELAEAIDEIAERIRALGEYAPGSLQEFSALTSLKEASAGGGTAANDMLKNLIEDHDVVLKTIRAALDVAQKAGDDATADMLVSRIEAHDKNKWMLKSSL
jgi:starvation-inducible DNA-binding protein